MSQRKAQYNPKSIEDAETAHRRYAARTEEQLKRYNQDLVQLALSRNLPQIVSVQPPQQQQQQTTGKSFFGFGSSSNNQPQPLALTCFDGYTNDALLARYSPGKTKPAALVYCSAGMIGGQLSGHTTHPHYAQEEGTLVENPFALAAVSDAVRISHPDVARTQYPYYLTQEAQQRVVAQQPIITPSFGFAIDQVVPLTLSQKYVGTGVRGHEDDQAGHIAYIMQAAIHYGCTNEDEGTNYMFTTNPQLLALIHQVEQSLQKQPTATTKITTFHELFYLLRRIAHTAGSAISSDVKAKVVSILDKTRYTPLKLPANLQGGGFDSSSDAYSRVLPRIALQTLLFGDIALPVQMQQSSTGAITFASSSTSANSLFQHFVDNYKTIQAAAFDALELQVKNQCLLTQQINATTFISGMYGCGVYCNDWREVAVAYGKVLANPAYSGHLKEVVFCNKLNDSKTREVLKNFIQLVADVMNGNIEAF